MALHKTLRLIALALVVALTLAACGGDDSPPDTGDEVTETPEAPAICPLTGEDPEEELPRPAVAVKIENSPQSRPQSGLLEADIVFEEIVEGGVTRFAAIYHCGSSKKVGPVRSARFDDPAIVGPITKVLAYSGANKIVEKELNKNGMQTFTEQKDPAGAFFREPEGSTDVHSLRMDVEKLRDDLEVSGKSDPPTDLFTFGEAPASAKKAKKVTLNFSSSNIVVYKWARGAWRRFQDGVPFNVQPGGQVAVPNVLVQEVRVDPSCCIVDVTGNRSPDIKLEGSGKLLLFRDGVVIEGEWTVGEDGVPVYSTAEGDPMPFKEGAIWVELVPSKKGQVKGGIAVK
jgi:hypothetical protein